MHFHISYVYTPHLKNAASAAYPDSLTPKLNPNLTMPPAAKRTPKGCICRK